MNFYVCINTLISGIPYSVFELDFFGPGDGDCSIAY